MAANGVWALLSWCFWLGGLEVRGVIPYFGVAQNSEPRRSQTALSFNQNWGGGGVRG